MHRLLRVVATLILMASSASFCQDHARNSTGPNVLAADSGTVIQGTYKNELLGFAYTMPDGWYVNSEHENSGSQVKGKYLPGGSLLLLMADQHTGRPFKNRLLIIADDKSKYQSFTSVQDYVGKVVRGQTNKLGMQLIRDVYPIDLSGKQFFRSDYDENFGGGVLYKTFICTELNGHFLSWTFATGSREELEAAVSSLQGASFRQVESSPGPDPNSATTSSNPPVAKTSGAERPMRVRISQIVSQALLITKIQPQYPDEARRNHIQGNVVMKAVISRTGEVKELTVISGHPSLTPGALEAVKQWKYRPYQLNGDLVEVETQVTVAFQLSDH